MKNVTVSARGLSLSLLANVRRGWLAARLLSAIITRRTEVLVTAQPGWHELHLVLGFISLTLILALLPAIAATKRTLLSDLRP